MGGVCQARTREANNHDDDDDDDNINNNNTKCLEDDTVDLETRDDFQVTDDPIDRSIEVVGNALPRCEGHRRRLSWRVEYTRPVVVAVARAANCVQPSWILIYFSTLHGVEIHTVVARRILIS